MKLSDPDGPAMTDTPTRIQRQRTKGWRMPENTVSVTRPGPWGNPFVVGQPCGVFPEGMGLRGAAETLIPALSLEQCITFYADACDGHLYPEMYPTGHRWIERFQKRYHTMFPGEAARSYLRGKHLACFCPLDQPCHADVLLELANAEAAALRARESTP